MGNYALLIPLSHLTIYMFKLIIGFALCSTLMTLTNKCGVVLKQWDNNPHWLTEASSKFQWVYFLFFFPHPVF
jgi:hypothetical protein